MKLSTFSHTWCKWEAVQQLVLPMPTNSQNRVDNSRVVKRCKYDGYGGRPLVGTSALTPGCLLCEAEGSAAILLDSHHRWLRYLLYSQPALSPGR